MDMTTPIGSEALIPNPALRPLERLLGQWQTTGTHPYLPGTVLHGRTSFAWHEGGAFVIMRSEVDEPEIPSGVAIFGSDDQAGTFFMLYFDERGVSRKYDLTLTEQGLTWQRDDPTFAQRSTLTIDETGNRMVNRGELRKDGGNWEDDLSLTFTRASS